MSRRIVTRRLEATDGAGGSGVDDYAGRLVKYIPADVVAAWVTVSTLLTGTTAVGTNAANTNSANVVDGAAANTVASAPNYTTLWIVFAVFVLITAFWTWRSTQVSDTAPVAKTQIIISTISFVVWVFGLGAPFDSLTFVKQQPALGAVVLIIWTLIAGRIVPPKSEDPPAPPAPPAAPAPPNE